MSSPEFQSTEDLLESAFSGEGNEATQPLRDLIRLIDNDTHIKIQAADPEGIKQKILVEVYETENRGKLFELREVDIDEDGKKRTHLSVTNFSEEDITTDLFAYEWYASDQENAVTFTTETTELPEYPSLNGTEAAEAMRVSLHEMSSYVAISSMNPNVTLALNPIY